MEATTLVQLLRDVTTKSFLQKLGDALDPTINNRFIALVHLAERADAISCSLDTGGRTIGGHGHGRFKCSTCTLEGKRAIPRTDADVPQNKKYTVVRPYEPTGAMSPYCQLLARFCPSDVFVYKVKLENGSSLLLMVGRTRPADRFTIGEAKTLSGCAEVVGSLVEAHWLSVYASSTPTHPTVSDDNYIEACLQKFAKSRLTDRENQVLLLVVRGYSSKQIAYALKIASQTEKVHRRNVYSKLGVRSQGQLFARLLEFIAEEQRRSGTREDVESTIPMPQMYFLSGRYQSQPRAINIPFVAA